MKKKCIACDARLKIKHRKVYTVYEPQTFLQALSGAQRSFDAVDCQKCGCQNVLAVRLPAADDESAENEDCEE